MPDDSSFAFASQPILPENGSTSFVGRRWQLREGAISDVEGIDIEDVARTLAIARDVVDVDRFLNPSVAEQMPEASDFQDMDRAVARIVQEVQSGGKVALFGDYDVDGATSVAIMHRYLGHFGIECPFHIPDRIEEGYGANGPALCDLGKTGAGLVLILDSGTNAHDAIDAARDAGMDVVVVDHHTQAKELPNAIVINPNRADEDKSYGYLCTAGLCYVLVQALNHALLDAGVAKGWPDLPDMRPYLGLACLGTVADVMRLVEFNRAIVAEGLEHMDKVPGIVALASARKVARPFKPSHCGFQLGPCINAGGRIGDSMMGTRLLITEDRARAESLAAQLSDLNEERKTIERDAVSAASKLVETGEYGKNVAVVHDPAWHPGVVGLIASRLKDRYNISAIAIGTGGKGSGRGIEGFDLGAAVISAHAEGLLEKGGGHPAAAGLTINPDKIPAFRSFMDEKAKGCIQPPVNIDIFANCGTLTPAMVESLDALAPFGMGNSAPRVVLMDGYVSQKKVLKGKHFKLFVTGAKGTTEAIAWSATEQPIGRELESIDGHYVKILGHAEVNEFRGKRDVVVIIKDIIRGDLREAVAA